VLEIGAGCGFQTAILVQMGFEVHAIELVDTLTQIAAANLQRIGLQPASLVTGNGRLGLPDEAPFDAILCAAASNNIPEAWYEQLRDAGQLIAPLGEQGEQTLIRCEKDIGDWKRESLGAVAFVPLVEASIE
jgi:protein-L-isoaspartate(D-aspartate) O-methyltransferase